MGEKGESCNKTEHSDNFDRGVRANVLCDVHATIKYLGLATKTKPQTVQNIR